MHGRVKVRTSEEEKARKEKERQEKLKVFKHVMMKIHEKRKEKELDNEMLDITGKVLVSNPDIYTLWNIRREVINSLRDTIESEENKAKLYDEELTLTEYCLKINPKSYCAWHQREWVLITRTDPDWKKELNLCDIYLKLDERNFHTWDYRRFIVAQYKPSLKDEFDFTTEKIYENFSNYSAWHYRSKMLVELHPDLEGGRPIEDNKHKHELKIVQSAAFTDPDDTSAWFYQRWLLGAVKKSLNVAVCTVTPLKTTVAFSQHVPYDFVKSKVQLLINNVPISGDWISCSDNQYDILWIYKHNETIRDNLNITVEYEANDREKQIIQCVKNVNSVKYTGRSEIEFQANYSQSVVDELKQQLEACRQLLSMEPDNKWTLLTTTVFLHCIDAKLYHKETIQNLQTLRKIDSLRAGYYDDLMTKWNIEEQLSKDCKGDIDQFKISFQEKITSLPHLQYYSCCDVVDLSNQNLTSKVLPSLVVLQHCKVLRLNKNNLTTLKGFPTLELEELHLQNNDLDENEIKHFKEKCKYNVYF